MGLLLINKAESQSSGTTVTTGNSGDAVSQAWDEVVIGANMTETFDNGAPLTGANAFKVALTSTATAITYVGWTSASIGAPVRRLFGGFSFFSATVPAASSLRLVQFLNGSTVLGYLSVDASGSGNFQFRSSADAAIGTAGTALSASTLYRFMFDIFFDGTLASCRAWAYNASTGARLAADAFFTGAFGTSAGCDHIRIGATTANFSSTSGQSFSFDDIWISDQPQIVLPERFVNPKLIGLPGQGAIWTPEYPETIIVAGGGISANLGLVTESDIAQTLARLKNKNLGLNTETDTANPLTRNKSKTLGLILETDLAQALIRAKSKTIGLVLESDAALALSRSKAKALGLVSETDLALALSRLKAKTLGVATETDLALGLSRLHSRVLGLVSESDLALALQHGINVVLGLVTETDLPLSLSAIKTKLLGAATETDAAQPITKSKARTIGIVIEGDSLFPLSKSKVKLLGFASEADVALHITHAGAVPSTVRRFGPIVIGRF